ncbi:MAG: glutathione S-transferase family protein [Pseudomonadales bacterium]
MSIELVTFKSGFGVPCPSTFCMKVEILLKTAGLEYHCRVSGNPKDGPKGKLPFIIDDEETVADSALIQAHLEKKYRVDFDQGLDAHHRAIAHTVARMIEERLYWVMVYDRWINDKNWHETSSFWFGSLPPVLRSIVPVMARKQVKGNLQSHGIGRHSAQEIYDFGRKDIDALADLLGSDDYMLGSEPCSLDAVAYPVLANIATDAIPGKPHDAVHAHQNLMAYIARCEQRWYANFVPRLEGNGDPDPELFKQAV